MAIKYWLDGNANWTTAANWTGGTVPGAADDVTIYQGNPSTTAAISIKSLTTTSPGTLDFQSASGTSQVSGNVANGGNLFLDRFGGQGNSKLNIGGTFTNTGNTQIGNGSLGAATTLTTQTINNTGTIELDGSASQRASLVVNNVAGFGTAGTVTGTIRLFGNSRVSFTSGQIKTLAANSYLRLGGANAFVVNASGSTSSTALSGLNTINRNATLILNNGNVLALSGFLNTYGTVALDNFGGDGGSSLTVAGKLTNIGAMQIGNGSLAAASTVTVNTFANQGQIELDGAGTKRASLIVNSTASFGTVGTLSGQVRLFGNTLISFASGQIKTLAANSSLRLSGANANIADAGQTTTNSALTGLTTINRNATFILGNGSSVALSGALTNYGSMALDLFGGDGGASLTMAGRFTNIGSLQIGNNNLAANNSVTVSAVTNKGTIELDGTATKQAKLTVGSAAGFGTATVLTGTVRLFNNSLISFTSGQIKTIGAGSYLRLNGTNAFIADVGSTTSNSALTGLTSVGNGAQFLLGNGASVAVTASFSNYGNVLLDLFGGEGGSSFSIAGRLNNQGFVQVNNTNSSADDSLTVSSLNNTGRIEIYGTAFNDGVHTDFTGRLIVNSAAGTGTAGHLSGSVYLQGHSLLQFNSGQISTIDAGGALRINGVNAFVANSTGTTSNTALTGLTNNDGSLFLDNGATISTTSDFTNYGAVNLDLFGGESGSSMTVAGNFYNGNSVQVGNGSQTLADTLTVASLTNDGGSITLLGGTASASVIVHSVAGTGAAGVLSGSVFLQNNALLQFDSGQIDTIDTGASLRLYGSDAHVARAGSTTTNSALTGLTQNNGTLSIENGASVTTSGALTNYGAINLDPFGGESNASLTIGGALTNEGTISMGNGGQSLAEVLTAASLTNNGTINLNGNPNALTPAYPNLAISGNIVNNGSIVLNNDQQTFASNVSGFGSFILQNSSTLQFNGNVASAQTVDLSTGADKLVLGNAKTFAGTIDDFGFGDKIDLTTFGAGTTLSYAQNAANTGGVLTATSGANVAKLNFDGVYTTANFTASADGMGGTLLSYT